MPDSDANPARKYKKHTLTDEARADINNADLGHQEVARKHGLPVHVVKYHREPKEPDRLRKIPLDEKHLLGKLSDGELADRWHVTRAAVHIARQRAGIPLPPKAPKKSLQPPARKYKKHTLTDEARADINNADLGHQEVARKHGLPVHVVKYHREPTEPDRLRKIPLDEKHLLGKLSDSELADRWNVTRAAVHIARKRAKIPLAPKPPKKSLQLL